MRVSLRRLILLPSGTPLACLALAVLAPAPARGGCDYPTHIERTPINPAADLPNSTAVPKSPPRIPNKPGPCNGPNCSRQPLVPPVPSSVNSVTTPEWGRLIPRLLLVPPHGETRVSDDPIPPPSRHPSTIYHPPRLSS